MSYTTQGYKEVLRSNINGWIGRRGVKQLEVAAALGISGTALSKKLHGRIEFKVGELVSIAQFLGVGFSELVEDMDEVIELRNDPEGLEAVTPA